tara:strand:+ start:216 stop:359 length:144 start_codon:yes stop_codon:yes gene_type:complete
MDSNKPKDESKKPETSKKKELPMWEGAATAKVGVEYQLPSGATIRNG